MLDLFTLYCTYIISGSFLGRLLAVESLLENVFYSLLESVLESLIDKAIFQSHTREICTTEEIKLSGDNLYLMKNYKYVT